MSKYSLVAMGGTFDIIHRGHMALLSNAFEISDDVIIGLTSDEYAAKKGKTPYNDYEKRFENLTLFISKEFLNHSFQIKKLNDDFGPAVLEKGVEALVVSDETRIQGDVLNKLRKNKKLPQVQIIVVSMILAKDGERISTSRIKNSEIDSEGNLRSIDK